MFLSLKIFHVTLHIVLDYYTLEGNVIHDMSYSFPNQLLVETLQCDCRLLASRGPACPKVIVITPPHSHHRFISCSSI